MSKDKNTIEIIECDTFNGVATALIEGEERRFEFDDNILEKSIQPEIHFYTHDEIDSRRCSIDEYMEKWGEEPVILEYIENTI